jgi:hypothetical protein
MATDLPVEEDQRQGIGEEPDHGQHYQRRGLMNGRMFQMAVGDDGLKNLGIDSPPAATELMDEQRRDQTQFEIGGVEVGALPGYRSLAFGLRSVFFGERDAAAAFDADCLYNPHEAVGDRPIDLRQVPVLDLAARFGVNARGRHRSDLFGFTQQGGLIFFQREGPSQTQARNERWRGGCRSVRA